MQLATTSVHLQFFNAISHSGLLKNVHGSWVESQGVCVCGGGVYVYIYYMSLESILLPIEELTRLLNKALRVCGRDLPTL